MYSDTMQRTQIYLSDEDVELLDRAAARTGASRSELIRRAIRRQYGRMDVEDKIQLLKSTAGTWEDFPYTGEEYVDAIRGDLSDRLRRLGFE